MTRTWKIAGISFEHMHMGDNLRMAHEHPRAEIVGLCDEQPERMERAAQNFSIPAERLYISAEKLLAETQPDIVILCPAAAKHGAWVERVAAHGVHVLIEKPMAASLDEADRMVAAMQGTNKLLAINWPLVWTPTCVTTKRLIDEGMIGPVIEVHHYGGNRGPLWHLADKVEVDAETVERQKPESWFYQQAHGGGSLLDYLGYGVTIGSWFNGGQVPLEVTCVVDQPRGLEVDEHSITVARYAEGLSKFETRWGTFTDPWTHQPQPRCGFVVVGRRGTISCYDYAPTLRVQTEQHPEGIDVAVDTLPWERQDPLRHLIHVLEGGAELLAPLTPEISRLGQQIIDTAVASAREKRTLPLLS